MSARLDVMLQHWIRLLILVTVFLNAPASRAWVYAWRDESGELHLANRAESIPPKTHIQSEWDLARSNLREEGPEQPVSRREPGREAARVARLLRDGVAELERGELRRAAPIFEDVLRRQPGCAEAHWYLASLEERRGRFESAEEHLRRFLANADEALEAWRAKAEARVAGLVAERRLAEQRGAPVLASAEHPHFQLLYDSALAREEPSYAGQVIVFLKAARAAARARFGCALQQPLRVILYRRATYLEAYGQRFRFGSVGFFDGRIHAVARTVPDAELRARLFHEYAHALFRERTGDDHPFWLNEGLAELLSRADRGEVRLARSDLAFLRAHIESGGWRPLSDLTGGFANLEVPEARLAYVQAAAAALWLDQHLPPDAWSRLFDDLSRGRSLEAVLLQHVGRDSAAIDRAVRAAILAEFAPAVP